MVDSAAGTNTGSEGDDLAAEKGPADDPTPPNDVDEPSFADLLPIRDEPPSTATARTTRAPSLVAPSNVDTAAIMGSSKPAVTLSPRAASRRVKLLNGKLTIDTFDHPILGSPRAEAVVVELVDYTCHGCRRMHHLLTRAKSKYGADLSVVVFPCPLDPACNPSIEKESETHQHACELARLALAVWQVSPSQFTEFHGWLMADVETSRTLQEALSYAIELTGSQSALKEAAYGRRTLNALKNYTSLFGAIRRSNEKAGLPIQILGNRPLVGVPDPDEEEKLFEVWETFVTANL